MQQLINKSTKFDSETIFIANSLKLRTMLLVEIFPNLHILDVSNNEIRKMEGLSCLRWLKKLDLSLNKITKIEGLENMHCLRHLVLSSNCITVIEGIFHMANLVTLELSNNKIEKVPDEISELKKIQEIYLSNFD